jgi:NitT/TauT family transport system substrate-binding protein
LLHKNILNYVAVIVIGLFLSACSDSERPLRVGSNQWLGYETLYLARSLGYFDEKHIELVELNSATTVAHAFQNEILDVAALTLDEVLTLMQTEDDLRVILVMDTSNGADALLAAPSITTLGGLKGKRVGVENTAVGALVLVAALTEANLTVSDVQVVPLTVDKHFLGFKEGRVDAVVSFEPVITRLHKAGARILFDSTHMPNQIIDVLVTRQSVIDSRSAALATLVQQQFKALRYFETEPERSVMLMSPRLATSAEALMLAYKGVKLPNRQANRRMMAGQQSPLMKSVEKLVSVMMKEKLLYKKPLIKQLIDARFIQ